MDAPAPFVMMIGADPAVPAGTIASMRLSDTRSYAVALTPPIFTPVAPVVPVKYAP